MNKYKDKDLRGKKNDAEVFDKFRKKRWIHKKMYH